MPRRLHTCIWIFVSGALLLVAVRVGRPRVGGEVEAPGREPAVGAVVVVEGQADLLQVVLAAQPGGGLADLLHGGQEQADEHRDDGDHHQQLDQREPRSQPTHKRSLSDGGRL